MAFEVPEGRGGDAVEAMRTLGLGGLSVTMPHKAAVWAAVDERTPVAAELGAVNCVFWRGDRLVGDNTDGAGLLDALRDDQGIEVAGLRCVVVGAGGAGRAVANALGWAGAADVAILNRSPKPAAEAAALAGAQGRVGTPADVGIADLVVNATPVGMAGDIRGEWWTGAAAARPRAAGARAGGRRPDLPPARDAAAGGGRDPWRGGRQRGRDAGAPGSTRVPSLDRPRAVDRRHGGRDAS